MAALLLGAPRLAYADLPPAYAGSHLTTPASTVSPSPNITAQWIRKYNNGESFVVKTWFTTPAGLAPGCPAPGEVQLTTATGKGQAVNSTLSAATAQAPCNGRYTFRLLATLTNAIFGSDQATLEGAITVVGPPPPVNRLNGDLVSGTVSLTWAAVADPPPDFLGYRLERKDSGGRYSVIATLDPDQRSFTDSTPPTDASEATYRVLTRRSGPDAGEVLSETGATTIVTLPTPTTSSTEPGATDGGTTTGATGGTAGTTGGTAGTTGGGTGGGTAGTTGGGKGSTLGGDATKPLDRGQVGSGVNAPNVGRNDLTTQLTLPDEGDGTYDPTLHYDTGGDGLAGEGTGDGLSSALYEQDSGRGMAVPVATGFVLAAWAFHLRFLARAAKPAPAPARRGRHAV